MQYLRLYRLADNLTSNICKITSARYLSQYPMRFHETQNMWRQRDGVSQRWQLIYKAPMDTALKYATTYLTVTSGIIGVGGLYYGAFVYDVADINKPVMFGEGIVVASSAIECLVYLGTFLALHAAIKLVLAKYVLRLYKHGDEYVAIYRGHFFNSVSKHKFNVKDFKKLTTTVILPWSESSYSLGSKKGIIMENYFKTPEHYNDLLNKKNASQEEEE